MKKLVSRSAKTGFGSMVSLLLLSLVLLTACGDNATPPPPVASTTSSSGSFFSTTSVAARASTAASAGSTTTAASGGAGLTTEANPIASTQAKSPCSLVTKAEAEAILGEAVKEPSEQYGGCTFYLVTAKPNTLASIPWVSVTWSQGTRDNFNNALKVYGAATPESGLGDYAVSASGFLFILKGSNIISIQPGSTQIPAQQVRAFALKALGRV